MKASEVRSSKPLMVRVFMRRAHEGVSNHEGSRSLDADASQCHRSLVVRDAALRAAPHHEGAGKRPR